MELAEIVGLRNADQRLNDSLAAKLGIDFKSEYIPQLEKAKNEFKNYLIDNALSRNYDNISAAARELNIDRKTIERRFAKTQEHSITFNSGKEAAKSAIYKVLNQYLPEVSLNKELLELKAEEMSKVLESYKFTMDQAVGIFESYVVGIAVEYAKDRKKAAEMLGVSTRTVERKLRDYN